MSIPTAIFTKMYIQLSVFRSINPCVSIYLYIFVCIFMCQYVSNLPICIPYLSIFFWRFMLLTSLCCKGAEYGVKMYYRFLESLLEAEARRLGRQRSFATLLRCHPLLHLYIHPAPTFSWYLSILSLPTTPPLHTSFFFFFFFFFFELWYRWQNEFDIFIFSII